MERKIETQVKGFHAIDGGGVHLVRVLGNTTVKAFNPFLMLDSFDSTNPEDYVAGFPMHPHRGIETITFQTILCSTTLSVDELLAMGGEDTEVVLTHHIRSSTLTVGGKAV